MEPGELSRRELLRRGLVAGGSAAAFGLISSSASAATAEHAKSPTSAAVSLGLAPEWPWGAAVDPAAPYYLSPGTQLSQSSLPIGFAKPLLVVPLLISVALGHPPALRPPFNVHIVATGAGLDANSVTLDVPFVKRSQETFSGSGGQVLNKSWLGVFPVVSGPGTFELQATIQTASQGATASSTRQLAGSAGSTLAIEADSSNAPPATSLPPSDQTALMGAVGTQLGFSVKDLFALINDAVEQAAQKLQEIKQNTTGINIGDMFEMQMIMNRVAQLDELSVQVVSEANTAIQSMAHNVRG